MIHTFHCLKKIFLLDVESGSVFEIDELTENIIKEKLSPTAKAEGDFSGYNSEDVIQAKAEIDQLIAEKILFSPDIKHEEPCYKGVVKALCLNIAHACNLRCGYCFAGEGDYGQKGIMSIDTAKKAIDFLIEKSGTRKQLEVDFFGGEPLLNMDTVRATIDYARSIESEHGKVFRFTITTNAVNLDDELTDYFNENMYNVVLSIDGRECVHNNVRKMATGADSFDLVLNNIKNFVAKRGDKSYYVRGTFTAENLDFAQDALFLNDIGFVDISLEPVVLPADHKLALKPEHVPQLVMEYENLAREYIIRKESGQAFNFFHFNMDMYNGPCASKRLMGCNAGDEYLGISTDGKIYPCHRFDGDDDYIIGNVCDKSFDTTIPTTFATTNLTKKESCPDCWAKYYCSGGCAANSIYFAGGIKKPFEVSCELMKKRVECSLAIFASQQK